MSVHHLSLGHSPFGKFEHFQKISARGNAQLLKYCEEQSTVPTTRVLRRVHGICQRGDATISELPVNSAQTFFVLGNDESIDCCKLEVQLWSHPTNRVHCSYL